MNSSTTVNTDSYTHLKQLISASVLTTLLTYYETNNIIQSIGAGLLSGTMGLMYLQQKSNHDEIIVRERNNRIRFLLDHTKHSANNLSQTNDQFLADLEYKTFCNMVANTELPAALVDLQAFDHNIEKLAKVVTDSRKNIKIRLATKSLRTPDLIQRALEKGGDAFSGLMCYSAKEAQYLYTEKKLNDLLIAYPTVQQSDLALLRSLHESGAKISLVIDSIEHLQLISRAMNDLQHPLPLVVDMDMSLRYLNGNIHLGVRRSPIHTLDQLRDLLHASKNYPNIKIIGVMGYEAGVAGLTDNNPFKSQIMNGAANIVRNLSLANAKQIRSGVPEVFREAGLTLEVFNGGGSGSVNLTIKDEALTEITAGSALFCPGFVSDFTNIEFDPALYIALQVVRSSDPDYITCGLGGGIIASGSTGPERTLRVVSPPGLSATDTEGFGEVQTPLKVTGNIKPPIGMPVFFRPAKAGESTEHFNTLKLIENDKMVGEAKTYRGVGLAPG